MGVNVTCLSFQCVKSVQIQICFWSVFSAFGLNTERCEVSFGIQSECGKIRTRKNSIFGYILRSVRIDILFLSVWVEHSYTVNFLLSFLSKYSYLQINAWSILNLLPHAQLMEYQLIFHAYLMLIRSQNCSLLRAYLSSVIGIFANQLEAQIYWFMSFSLIFPLFILLLMSFSKTWCLSFCFDFICL